MAEVTEYMIQQIVDNGNVVQITLAENVATEPISQKQMIMDSLAKKLDPEMKEQEVYVIFYRHFHLSYYFVFHLW